MTGLAKREDALTAEPHEVVRVRQHGGDFDVVGRIARARRQMPGRSRSGDLFTTIQTRGTSSSLATRAVTPVPS